MGDNGKPPGVPSDPRRQRRREQARLFWAVVAFLLVGGSVTIALVYGPRAAVLGLTCLSAGAVVLLFLWAILNLIERWSK